jgi:hypothetical protein
MLFEQIRRGRLVRYISESLSLPLMGATSGRSPERWIRPALSEKQLDVCNKSHINHKDTATSDVIFDKIGRCGGRIK